MALAAGVVLGLSAGAAAAAPATGTWQFQYTGHTETFVVPDGVHKMTMFAVGGAGEHGNAFHSGAPGGLSGMTFARFPVTPGEVLTVWVGGQGSPKTGPAGVSWGFGCGAAGGQGEDLTGPATGGGGGASSAVTRGDFHGNQADCRSRPAESEILMVAGGGGGGGGNSLSLPPSHDVSIGGRGGDGGHPPKKGQTGGEVAVGGCGGCLQWYYGQAGTPNLGVDTGSGGGGGGGGYRGGGGGAVAVESGSGGGGGGSSYIAPGAEDFAYLAGYGSGAGSVVLSTLDTVVLPCTGGTAKLTVPSGIGLMRIEAIGGAGGTTLPGASGTGGPAGTASTLVEVSPGESVEAVVGCGGTRSAGFGWGHGGAPGKTPSPFAIPGAGGGGSSAVLLAGKPVVIGGGGGGGGGNGSIFLRSSWGAGGHGGVGGHGGFPPADGARGLPDDYSGGHGGRGGQTPSHTGGAGGTAGHGSLGGGGGGGGAGWYSGAGGYEGRLGPNLVGGGAGGGGGGMSGVTEAVSNDFDYGVSRLAGDGLVELTYLPASPAAISAYGGSKQRVTVGEAFPQQLAALVTDHAGNPVSDAVVQFALPIGGAGGSFSDGGTVEQVATGQNGVATSSPIIANRTPGP
ncbi:MAG TPA: hypothetical protein VEB65_05675, partial [Solirubrobacterales bacterium]|nr:hypothetical protein [Solirubrobacterales bacterium]